MLTARVWLLALQLSFVSFTFSHRVFAQEATDAGVSTINGETFTADLAAVIADPSNVEALSKLVLHAIMTGQWGLLVSLLVMGLVAGLRKFIPEASKVGQWLRSKLGGVTTAFTVSLAGAFATSFLAGAPLSWALALKAVSVAFTASGSWAIFKNIREAMTEKKAQEGGVAAETNPPATLDK